LIILCLLVYLILRFFKVDVKGRLNRLIHRNSSFSESSRSWKPNSWKQSLPRLYHRSSVQELIPPPYEEIYAPEKRALSASPLRDMKFAPLNISATGTTPLITNPAPFGASSPVEHNPSAGMSYFITNPDRNTIGVPPPSLERNTSNASADSNNATYYGTYDSNIPYSSIQQYHTGNIGVQQPSGAYMGPNSRLSELSSLSSGFGDAKIDVPESGPSRNDTSGLRVPRKASSFLGRFSWATNSNPHQFRDTFYTNTSDESAPRFRSVTSWVNQQTSRITVQGGQDHDTPRALTELPVAKRKPPISAAFQLAQARGSVRHSRQGSEDGAFRAHPGQEVRIGRVGSRVASSILDGNFGGEEGVRYGRR
jgi:hypothetical protein